MCLSGWNNVPSLCKQYSLKFMYYSTRTIIVAYPLLPGTSFQHTTYTWHIYELISNFYCTEQSKNNWFVYNKIKWKFPQEESLSNMDRERCQYGKFGSNGLQFRPNSLKKRGSKVRNVGQSNDLVIPLFPFTSNIKGRKIVK